MFFTLGRKPPLVQLPKVLAELHPVVDLCKTNSCLVIGEGLTSICDSIYFVDNIFTVHYMKSVLAYASRFVKTLGVAVSNLVFQNNWAIENRTEVLDSEQLNFYCTRNNCLKWSLNGKNVLCIHDVLLLGKTDK